MLMQDIALHLAPFDTSTCLDPKNSARNETVWVVSEGATLAQASMFAMYPIFPAEFLSTATATKQELATAQATARIECDLAGGRPVEVFAATVLSGGGASDIAWTPEDVVGESQLEDRSWVCKFSERCRLLAVQRASRPR